MMTDIDRIRDALNYVPPNDRDIWLRMGMAIKSEVGESGFDLWDAWSQQADSYVSRDARDVWKSIKSSGRVTAGTLFHEAKASGWRDDGAHRMPTPDEIGERKRIAEERGAREEAETVRERAEAAITAAAKWKAAKPAPADHPYLLRKGIKAHGARLAEDGRLVIPLRADGALHSLQYIGADGEKRFLPGGRVAGCYYSIGATKDAKALCIAEGFATGSSVYLISDESQQAHSVSP
jgi:putative DNA primase/helicase